MRTLNLSSDTYFCEYEDNAIFLNLSQNRYYAVDAETVRELRRCVSEWPQSREAGAIAEASEDKVNIGRSRIDDLLLLGLLTALPNGGKPALTVAISSSLESFPVCRDDPTTFPRIEDLIRFFGSLATTWVALRFFGLKSTIHRMERLGSGSMLESEAREAMEKVKSLTARFFRIRSWVYTARNACLLDSLVFWDFLRRNGVASTLIIGVKLKPFGAHAWIQFRDLVLTDTPEAVSTYRVLLVQGRGRL